MNSFLLSIVPRLVQVGGGTFEVPAPSLRQALIILLYAEDALRGDEDSRTLVFDTVTSWMPPKALRALRSLRDGPMLREVIRIANADFKSWRKKQATGEGGASTSVTEMDWDFSISSVIAYYRMSFNELMDIPWPAFLVLMDQMPRLRAHDSLRDSNVASMPHMDRDGRRQAIWQLKNEAGIDPIRRMKPQEQAQALKSLEAQFAAFGAFNQGGDTPQS